MVIPAAAAQRVAQRLCERLGVATTREALAAIPIERSLQAQAEPSAELAANRDPRLWGEEVALSMVPWQPVIDGDVIPSHPMERIAGGAGAEIDLMAGSTLDEWRLFLVPNGVMDQITPPGWHLPPTEPASGRNTGPSAEPRCASIQCRRSWTILSPRSEPCGQVCVS